MGGIYKTEDARWAVGQKRRFRGLEKGNSSRERHFQFQPSNLRHTQSTLPRLSRALFPKCLMPTVASPSKTPRHHPTSPCSTTKAHSLADSSETPRRVHPSGQQHGSNLWAVQCIPITNVTLTPEPL
ncbi:hypothetical protein PM082_007534 [Marasmius tenuissimus]|nr:hypothetical protein PM082_007534 [Marasmius tenuissimus]